LTLPIDIAKLNITIFHFIKEETAVKTVRISLNSIDKVKSFVNELVKFSDVDFDLVSGRYVIDAKSIMGIFSLDLSKPIDLNIHADANRMDEILSSLTPYVITE
jgi:phosphotransferase system HPr-like phosphotransfer protein